MNYSAIQESAHHALGHSKWNPRLVTLIFTLILFVVTIPCELVELLEEHEEVMGWRQLLTVSTVIAVVVNLYTYAMDVGFRNYALRLAQGKSVTVGDFAAAFRMCGRFFLLYVLKTAMIFLWTLLLIVPGYLALFRYRLAEELMLDDPDMKPWEALRRSAELTKGHRMELFLLDLRFYAHFILVFLAEECLELLEWIGHPIENPTAKVICFLVCMVVVLLVELWHKAHLYAARAEAYKWVTSQSAVAHA